MSMTAAQMTTRTMSLTYRTDRRAAFDGMLAMFFAITVRPLHHKADVCRLLGDAVDDDKQDDVDHRVEQTHSGGIAVLGVDDALFIDVQAMMSLVALFSSVCSSSTFSKPTFIRLPTLIMSCKTIMVPAPEYQYAGCAGTWTRRRSWRLRTGWYPQQPDTPYK